MIPSGPVLKYGKDKKGKEVLMEDPRVPALRNALRHEVARGRHQHTTSALADTIAKFQKEHSLQPTGQLTAGDARRHQRSQARASTVDIILANMERWRWVPRDLGKTHVMVNIPDYTLRVMRDGKLVWTTQDRGRQAEPRDAADHAPR